MSVRLYDNAFLNKIKSWVKDPNMTITSPDETRRYFEYKADINNDKPIQLPLVAIRRVRQIDIRNPNKTAMSYCGRKLHGHHVLNESGDLESCKVSLLNAIPIGIGYQIDIYTRYAEEADEYLRNFVYNIVNYPRLEIEIPYNNENVLHTCTMSLLNTAEDNSDIAERLVPGQFTRWTIGVRINDAYLFSVPIRTPYHIEESSVEVELTNKLKETQTNANN